MDVRSVESLNPLQNHNKSGIQTPLLHTYLYSKHTLFESQNGVNEVLRPLMSAQVGSFIKPIYIL